MDKHDLLKSYCQPDEKLLLAKVLDQADLSLKRHIVSFTDFLDPSMRGKAFELLTNIRDLKVKAFGGYEEAERVVFCVFKEKILDEDNIFLIF